jgi:XTP/dITP diphosphohydrolase
MALLLLATTNPGKLLEMQALLAGLPLELVLPSHLGITLDVIEDGNTYAENAAKKALAFSRAANLPALADDSGLEVDALDGEPGIHSHRYAPMPNASDADRRTYLLSCLADKPRPWFAHFHCTIALATPTGELQYAEGNCPGEIIPTERGSNGFGYDPIFLLNESGLTMAELSMEDKNRLSHRARAVQAALPILHRLFQI